MAVSGFCAKIQHQQQKFHLIFPITDINILNKDYLTEANFVLGVQPRFGPVSACFAEQEAVAECAMQLRRIGDKWNLRQKILNLLAKLFCPET
nr:PREDICTED: phorbol-12-myristate-13-acetate-induced protein 1 [Apteryx mantelli mantelli]